MSFLKFIKWSELENWSANFYFQNSKNIKFDEIKKYTKMPSLLIYEKEE